MTTHHYDHCDRNHPGESLTYSISETATLIGVSYHTVFRLLKRGKLRALSGIRHKRIPKTELERFLKEIE